jgi:hypothetical protein
MIKGLHANNGMTVSQLHITWQKKLYFTCRLQNCETTAIVTYWTVILYSCVYQLNEAAMCRPDWKTPIGTLLFFCLWVHYLYSFHKSLQKFAKPLSVFVFVDCVFPSCLSNCLFKSIALTFICVHLQMFPVLPPFHHPLPPLALSIISRSWA